MNRWELNRGYRGKSSGRNDLRLIECVLRVFGNLGRHSDPESILTIFARPRDFSKLPKTHARKGPRFQWLSELLRVPRQRAARLASVHRVFLPSFFQWNDNPRPFVWTAMVDSTQGKALAMSTKLEQIQPGCTLPRRRNRKQCPVNSWTPLAQLLHGLRLRQTIRGATSLLESPTCRA